MHYAGAKKFVYFMALSGEPGNITHLHSKVRPVNRRQSCISASMVDLRIVDFEDVYAQVCSAIHDR